MKIYTKTGDKATTSLFGGTRVPKHHIRIECYGTLDELNANLGLLLDQIQNKEDKKFLLKIQNQLFTLGSFLALDPSKETLASGEKRLKIPPINEAHIVDIEAQIDAIDKQLTPMTHFILPSGHPIVSTCHIARTVCRRAERLLCILHEKQPLPLPYLGYLNRLSDYLFVLARKLSKELRIAETKWTGNI